MEESNYSMGSRSGYMSPSSNPILYDTHRILGTRQTEIVPQTIPKHFTSEPYPTIISLQLFFNSLVSLDFKSARQMLEITKNRDDLSEKLQNLVNKCVQ